jgi:predicted acyl esterase
VKVPVYAVGGYADGYTNPIFRMMEHLSCPRKALVGPWAHKYPHFATPGPRIGFLQECLRWWDQHLKGIDTGIMDEPMIRAWMQDATAPDPAPAHRPGRWVAETEWPSQRTGNMSLHVTPGGLSDTARDQPVTIACPETAGHAAQVWCMYGAGADGPLDQRTEEGYMAGLRHRSIAADIEIFGFPILHLRVASDVVQANLAAVLSLVAPDGRATFVSSRRPEPDPPRRPCQAFAPADRDGGRRGGTAQRHRPDASGRLPPAPRAQPGLLADHLALG